MSQFNVQQQHPLIPREQTFVLDRKLVSIHSYDRDIKKWPNSNHFEIELPEDLRNIQSMRLINIGLPSNQYIFSNEYQNTKLKVFVSLRSGVSGDIIITINEGSYTPDQLATEIETKLNKTVATAIFGAPSSYNNFRCKYNSVSNTFWFGNLEDKFVLKFGDKIEYTYDCTQFLVWNNYKKWGLPAYLGYKKNNYESTKTPKNTWYTNQFGDPFGFDYEMEDGSGNEWLTDVSMNSIVNLNSYSINPLDPSGICNLDIMGEDYIYMELDKYNSMDEIEPYSENTTGWFNNDYTGKVKCAFAKIPVQCTPYSQIFDSTRAYIANISHYNPPIERIDRLRFRFRYHDGRLVDFKCLPFSFTLEFNMLRDEQLRSYLVRVPPLYCL
ncbi:MAG: hypothetical protein ACXADW_04220 [Candidatus Hodarchaeales archaeon]|jgi:hypothetical protein